MSLFEKRGGIFGGLINEGPFGGGLFNDGPRNRNSIMLEVI